MRLKESHTARKSALPRMAVTASERATRSRMSSVPAAITALTTSVGLATAFAEVEVDAFGEEYFELAPYVQTFQYLVSYEIVRFVWRHRKIEDFT